ncbi:MAG: WGR domain-containing protein [Myxococcales bacterium]|nr:WGR domain-containing protein [Myxococcales bacterium]
MAAIKAWKVGEAGAPPFSDDFEIVKKCVLQVTDIKTNHNKYYAIELHRGSHNKKPVFRVYTHYGRTDDLENNPEAGQKECRYASTEGEADAIYLSIFREKTSARKGYKEVSLASSKIGSQKARGTSAGEIDAKTVQRLAEQKAARGEAPVVKKTNLSPEVATLMAYIYAEATEALTTTVNVKITANGIETPLGILTLGQIEKGESILQDLYKLFQSGKKSATRVEELSSEFYTTIPHRIGRSRAAAASSIIDSMEDFQSKQETLQLMKDMLQVNGDSGSVLYDSQADAKYDALKCDIAALDPKSPTYAEIEQHVLKSQIKGTNIKVKGIFSLARQGEVDVFRSELSNQRLLFHGSRIKNWVGILSRGILLPKIVVSLGVNRTDAGWLGSGIYFGDASCTSAFYTSPGKRGTRFMAVARVALGKMKDYSKITYGLSAPPDGFDSCHGVRGTQFADDEYVVYDSRQQRLEYLVEFTM